MDAKLLKASQSSDARMLDCEFTILERRHARRKFWQSFTVANGDGLLRWGDLNILIENVCGLASDALEAYVLDSITIA